MGHDEVRQERLPRPAGALNQRVAHVLVVQVPEVRRLLLRLEDGQTRAVPEVRTGALPGVQREQEAEIRDVGSSAAPAAADCGRRCRARPRARRSRGCNSPRRGLRRARQRLSTHSATLGVEPLRVAVDRPRGSASRRRRTARAPPSPSGSGPISWTVAVAESSTSISSGCVSRADVVDERDLAC